MSTGEISKAPHRRLPDAKVVRVLAGGLFLLGLIIGFLGSLLPLLALALTADVGFVGKSLLIGSLGGVIAIIVSSISGSGPRRLLLFLAGPAAAGGLLALGMLYDATPARYALLAVCAGAALIGATVSRAWSDLDPGRNRESVLALGAVSLGLGALGSTAFVWLGAHFLQVRTSASAGALLTLVLSLWLWRAAGRTEISKVAPPTVGVSATSILFSLALVLKTSAYCVLGLWLPFYLGRQLGLSSTSSIGILAVFWLAVSVGRMLAIWAPRAKRFVPLLATSALAGGLGCVFLFFTPLLSGAAVGTALAGAALGALHPPTFRIAPADRDPIGPTFLIALALGPVAAGLVGSLAGTRGIAVFIWTALALHLAVPALVGLGGLESRLSTTAENQPGTL